MYDNSSEIIERESIQSRVSAFFKHPGLKLYLHSISWSLIGRFVTLGISFFVSAYVARYLGPSNYGLLSYAISFVSIFTFISTLGIDTVLYRSLIETPERRNVLMGSALRLRLGAGFVALLLAISVAWILRTGDISVGLIVMLSLSYIFNAWQIIIYEFQAQIDQKTPSLIALAISIILSILKLVVVFFDQGVIYLAAVLMLESILYAGFFIFIRRRKNRFPSMREWKYDPVVAREILRECWPLIFSTGFVLIYSRIDQIILKHYIDTTAVGLYDSAVRIAETWYVIPALLTSIFFPAIVNAKKHSAGQFRRRIIRLSISLALLSAFVSLIVQFLAPYLIAFLYGSAYAGGVTVLKIYMWSGIWMSIGFIVQYLLVLDRSTKFLAFTNMAAMVLNIILNIAFIPKYGINGAAIATAISYVVVALPIIKFFRHSKEESAQEPPQQILAA